MTDNINEERKTLDYLELKHVWVLNQWFSFLVEIEAGNEVLGVVNESRNKHAWKLLSRWRIITLKFIKNHKDKVEDGDIDMEEFDALMKSSKECQDYILMMADFTFEDAGIVRGTGLKFKLKPIQEIISKIMKKPSGDDND